MLTNSHPQPLTPDERDIRATAELRRFLDSLLGSRLVSAMALAAGSGVDQYELLNFIGGKALAPEKCALLDRFLRKYMSYGNPLAGKEITNRWELSERMRSDCRVDQLPLLIRDAARNISDSLLKEQVFTLSATPRHHGDQATITYELSLGSRPFAGSLSEPEPVTVERFTKFVTRLVSTPTSKPSTD